ncbi:hypothetical protein CBL_02949 [Carabus blaptoides fortunei]
MKREKLKTCVQKWSAVVRSAVAAEIIGELLRDPPGGYLVSLRSSSLGWSTRLARPPDIHRQLVEVYGEKCMDVKNVRKWCREFSEGRENVHDEQRSGRPSLSESTVARIDEMVRNNRRITLHEIITWKSKTTVNARMFKKEQTGTGGGPDTGTNLTDLEERLMVLIGWNTVKGCDAVAQELPPEEIPVLFDVEKSFLCEGIVNNPQTKSAVIIPVAATTETTSTRICDY